VVRVWRDNKETDWGFGVVAETLHRIERNGTPNPTSKTSWQGGLAFSYQTLFSESLRFQSSNAALYGGNTVTLETANELNISELKNWRRAYVGGDFELRLYFGSGSAAGYDLTTGLHVGWRF
jgi:hypothetical protein